MYFLDLQINGYYGADFNADDLTADALHSACEKLHDAGAVGILATIITADAEAMTRRLRRLAQLRGQDELAKKIIQGIHIEGPFLSDVPGYVGAHPAEHTCDANVELARRLLDAAGGLTRIVTLAPERDPNFQTTRYLADSGIRVSAGHCNPSLDQLLAAVDSGLAMFTHLGNGCPLMMHRHDNIIQRALSLADRLWIGLIADGVHIPFFALASYLRSASIDRCFVVTDAIAAAGQGPGTYRLGDQEVIVDEQLATWSPDRSHLMGSASTMPRIVENLRAHVGLSDDQIEMLTRMNPRRAIGLTE